ncbi:MAG TPA: hypothetical protein VFA26_16385 [Gemmataceae bacterium]|nr:hypothetical protein [Gemmataceae bacterium]
MNASPSFQSSVSGYSLRRLRPADAPGVTELVRAVYGDSYYPGDLYDPGRIVRLNEAGRLVSVVALAAGEQVVGHYALERPDLGKVAEASDAIVLPEHRHHHLLEEMRVLLREEALREGLVGLVGYPVTNHVFSQRAEDHFGSHPCGIALGLWPRTFHNLPEPLPQRMSFVIYFKYLRPPGQALHVATRHRDVCARICGQFGIPVRFDDDAGPAGEGEVEVESEPAVETGTVRVRRVGADTPAAVRQARDRLCGGGARAVTLELPLTHPGAAAVCAAAEADGFFFCGLGPAFAGDGDVLLLQYLQEDVDPSLLQVENPFAQELLRYVVAERDRVRGRPH